MRWTMMLTVFLAGLVGLARGEVDHGAWDRLLARHVSAEGGWVDYAGFKADEAVLDGYLATLASADYAAMGHDDRLAYLMNAYNAFTVKLILNHWDGGKLESIKDIPEDQRWKGKLWDLGGWDEKVSLDDIEHGVIRADFDEPRIHWALVCAAYSCPPLRNEAYVGDRLDGQLDAQEAYVMSFDHPRFAVRTAAGANVTKLLDWYGGDFGDAMAYVRRHLSLADGATVGFLDYSWVLNDVGNKP